jgi:hypothetical protein
MLKRSLVDIWATPRSSLEDKIRMAQFFEYNKQLDQRESELVRYPRFKKIMAQPLQSALNQLAIEVPLSRYLNELALADIIYQYAKTAVVATANTSTVSIWDLESKKIKLVLTKRITTPINCIIQLSNGSIAIGCSSGRLIIWNYLKGNTDSAITIFKGSRANITAILELKSADVIGRPQEGCKIIVGNYKGGVEVWNVDVTRPRKFKVINVKKEGLVIKSLQSTMVMPIESLIQFCPFDDKIKRVIASGFSMGRWEFYLNDEVEITSSRDEEYFPVLLCQLSEELILCHAHKCHIKVCNFRDQLNCVSSCVVERFDCHISLGNDRIIFFRSRSDSGNLTTEWNYLTGEVFSGNIDRLSCWEGVLLSNGNGW